jgi:hypothetical protein
MFHKRPPINYGTVVPQAHEEIGGDRKSVNARALGMIAQREASATLAAIAPQSSTRARIARLSWKLL